MDRDQLEAWIVAGLSLTEIGALTNRDPSTVGYWVEKYGLVANGREKYAPRGGLTRDQLEPLVEAGCTLAEIAVALDRSVSTVRHWLKRHGLRTKNRGGPRSSALRSRIEAAVEGGMRSVVAECPRHGQTDFAILAASGRIRCKRCRSEAVSRRRRRVKEILVDEAGGKCVICGYDRCVKALEFHHRDPSQKRFGLAHRGITRAIAEVRKEADKCVLLCANCHAEVEAGMTALP
jgi:DNA-binding CsgD family transcriptional regulator